MNISRRSFAALIAIGLVSPIGHRTISNQTESMTMYKEEIRQLLERLGEAVSTRS